MSELLVDPDPFEKKNISVYSQIGSFPQGSG